jgi:uncharacterized protein (DUF58 family)
MEAREHRIKSAERRPQQGMWQSFMSSIGLLAVALLSALYSSSAAGDAQVFSAVMSALIALAIAIWVALRFVPRLARNVEWDWLALLARFKITREGWIYLVGVGIVIFAAINTSNNLLYMMLAAMLAVLLLSGFLSGLNYRNLDIQVRLPANAYAAEPFSFSIRIKNEKRVFPTFSLQFEAPSEDATGSAPPRATIRFPAFLVPIVRAQQIEIQSGEAMLTRRGRYEINELQASSRYPFGFLVRERKFKVEAECICYPEIQPQDRITFSVLDILGSRKRFERGFGHDLYMIRDDVPSDSTRHVHWKASAKTGMLKTREYAAEESRRIVLAFDRFGEAGDEEKFEQLVSYAASLAHHMIKDGVEVALVSDDWRSNFGSSDALLESILRYLALVQMSGGARRPPLDSAGSLTLSLR